MADNQCWGQEESRLQVSKDPPREGKANAKRSGE